MPLCRSGGLTAFAAAGAVWAHDDFYFALEIRPQALESLLVMLIYHANQRWHIGFCKFTLLAQYALSDWRSVESNHGIYFFLSISFAHGIVLNAA